MPCWRMHCAAACSAAPRPLPGAWPAVPWLAAWLRAGTAGALEPALAHPPSISAPANAAISDVLFLIWTSRTGPHWAGREQLYAPADDRNATRNRAVADIAAWFRGTLVAATCAITRAAHSRRDAGRACLLCPCHPRGGTMGTC